MKPSNTLSFKLHAIVCMIDEIASYLLKQNTNINLPQFLVLLCVYENPGSSQKFIANWLQLTEATVSYTVKVVIEKGYLKIESDKSDLRGNRVLITSSGRNLIEQAYPMYEKTLEKYFSVLSKSELNLFVTYLNKIINSIEGDK